MLSGYTNEDVHRFIPLCAYSSSLNRLSVNFFLRSFKICESKGKIKSLVIYEWRKECIALLFYS